MIQANELRIGNWVQHDGYLLSLCGMDKKYAYVESNNTKDPYQHRKYFETIEPIPLTEEILLKCGFENDDFCPEYNHYGIKYDEVANYWFNIQRKIGTEIFFFETNHSLTQVQTVNQLQNLYFALTGEELIIEL